MRRSIFITAGLVVLSLIGLSSGLSVSRAVEANPMVEKNIYSWFW